jgi:23S rRNA (cytosine1962-C5)-methyltransferase
VSKKYSLVDSGYGHKLEQFGPYLVKRPAAQALWAPSLEKEKWGSSDLSFTRDGGSSWSSKKTLPKQWTLELEGILFKISPTDFGHLGVFPEHSTLWGDMTNLIQKQKKPPRILNLFAYSGGATLAAAKAGASVCHLDASKGMVAWARENAALNNLEKAPIRWIVDDVIKFLKREEKRGSLYDGIILDPPSFGRGSNGEVFKIETDLEEILSLCYNILTEKPIFVLFTSHTQGMSPLVMEHLLKQMMQKKKGKISSGEMIIPSQQGLSLPCGSFGKWEA